MREDLQALTTFLCTAPQLPVVLFALIFTTPVEIEDFGVEHGAWVEAGFLVIDGCNDGFEM